MNCLYILATMAMAQVAFQDEAGYLRLHWFEPGMEHGTPMPDRRFRVNSPDAVLHASFGKRPEAFASGMMQIQFAEDLFELEGAELALDMWGGHPGTASKRVTLNGRSTYLLEETGTAAKHCTHQHSSIQLKVTDLVRGYNALQFACDSGTSFWGHFIVDSACLRARLKDTHPNLKSAGLGGCRYAVKARAEGEKVMLALDSTAECLGKVDGVDYQGWWAGYNENGMTEAAGWHGFTKNRASVGYLGGEWDLRMVPDQQEMKARAWVRFKGLQDVVYRTASVEGLRTPQRGARVRVMKATELPAPFWSRAGRKQQAAIELDVDPAEIEEARLQVVLWDGGAGTVKSPFKLNGHAVDVLGAGRHDVLWRDVKIDPRLLVKGKNVVELLSDTEHHGIEVLLPGPALLVRAAKGIRVSEVEHQGQASLRISTERATYVLHKEGAGLASLIDPEGRDWISYRPGGGAGGEFRGIPNLGAVFHPGYTGEKGSKTRLIEQRRERVVVDSESNDGQWAGRWVFLEDRAEFTVLKAPAPYWFLYEGTPAGRMDLEAAWYEVPGKGPRPVTEILNEDLPDPEWALFGDSSTRRALLMMNHTGGSANDQFWQMEGKMTVFGFGRQYRCCGKYLTAAPAKFTVALLEDASKVRDLIGEAR